MANNRIVVGTENDLELFAAECAVSDWRWMSEDFGFPWEGAAKIRYRQEDQPVRLESDGPNVVARFAQPQRAVTPGQFFVAYSDDELVGSGVIAG